MPPQSYRQELSDAMLTAFPPQWFSQFEVHGNRVWTPMKVLWVSLAMSWQPRSNLREQFDAAVNLVRVVRPRWVLGNSFSGFLKARKCFLTTMSAPMRLWMQRQIASHFEHSRVRGWLLFGVDGSRFETCRTTDNEEGLGCAGKEGTTPQVFQTTLLHIGTGLVWDFRLGPGTDSERRHLDDMLPWLPPKSLLTADAGFISFNLCRWFYQTQRWFLLRVGSNVHLLRNLFGDVEVDGSTVYLWPEKSRHLPPIVLRLIIVQREGYRPVYLVTNLDESHLSEADAEAIYSSRWELEIHYRSHKQTFDHGQLQSRTSEMTLAEQNWHVMALWVLQWNTAKQLIAAKKNPAKWSAAKVRSATRTLIQNVLIGGFSDPTKSYNEDLKNATRDDYARSNPKKKRHWPRKKEEKPPGPPNIRTATRAEQQRAQRFRTSTDKEL